MSATAQLYMYFIFLQGDAGDQTQGLVFARQVLWH